MMRLNDVEVYELMVVLGDIERAVKLKSV